MYENELSKIQRLLEEKKLKEQAVLQAREDIVRTIDQNFGIKKMIMEAAREVGTGLNGKDGRDGKDGFHGLDGYTPIKGIDYFDGLNGRDGKDGKNGIDGKNGRDGLNGKNGTDGRNGTNGKNGKDGGSGKGRPGKDAFLYAQEAGYTGTEQEFTIALKNAAEGTGGEGTGGEDGKSAYEIWLELGNTGTEQNFIDSLKGADGAQGEQGTQGLKGDKGDTGDQGIQGVKGDTGDQGIQGIQGIQGVAGELTDPPTLANRSTPSSPAAGSLTLFAKQRAGRMTLNTVGPSGIDTALQPALFGNTVYLWVPGATTTVSIAFGTTWTARNASGAQSHPTKATTNILTQMNRALFSCTATTATSSGIQSANTVAVRGNAAGIGGFFYFSRFGVETLSGTGQQIVNGLSSTAAALTGEPSSTFANILGLVKDSGDTNWFFVSRNNTGTATKVDTGLTVTAGVVLDLMMFCKPNDSKVTVRLVRKNDGVVIMDDVEITATLPVNTTFLYAHHQLRNTGTAINAFALNRIYVECDI